MAAVTIRSAKPGDIHAILRIAERGWNETYGDFLSQETIESAMTEWYDPDTTRAEIEHRAGVYFVAEQNGAIRGYVSGGPSGEVSSVTLSAIYVDPDYWGDGIGTALLDEFEEFWRQRGYDTITLQVLARNEIGLAFYQKRGYDVIDGRETDLFGETVREYELRDELD